MLKLLNRKKVESSKGAASLVMILLILMIIITTALGLAFATNTALKLSGNSSDSVVAFYAAESGIEEALYKVSTYPTNGEPAGATCSGIPPSLTCDAPITTTFPSWVSVGSAQYYINVNNCICDGTISKIQAIGEYKFTRRSIEISF